MEKQQLNLSHNFDLGQLKGYIRLRNIAADKQQPH